MSNKTRTGWVYVLVNDSIDGQVKVGFTSGLPEDRARELHTSGVPTPYKVATAFLFTDKAYQIEREAHSLLNDWRVSPDREFFRCSGLDAADAIQRASEQLNQPPADVWPVLLTPEEIAERKRKEAEHRRLEMEKIKKEQEERKRLQEERKRVEFEQEQIDKFKKVKKAAEQGDALAQYELGRHYSQGKGVGQDYAAAVKWYRRAAEQEHGMAQYCLGACYANGTGAEQDDVKAAEWYRKAAEQGTSDAHAQYHLGYCFANGIGTEKDLAEAAKWYLKAAQKGHGIAQYRLGACYANGTGAEQDDVKAAEWYRKAAWQEHGMAQYRLGGCYANGTGVEQDEIEAAKWYRSAAEKGYAAAQAELKWLEGVQLREKRKAEKKHDLRDRKKLSQS